MNLRPLLFISAAALAASGCASYTVAECRSADWYDLGFRDAIYGLQPQDQVYAHGCDPQGVRVDQARYGQGWREGKWEADHRRNESIN